MGIGRASTCTLMVVTMADDVVWCLRREFGVAARTKDENGSKYTVAPSRRVERKIERTISVESTLV